MVALQSTAGIHLLFFQIPGVRAVVYQLDAAGDRLEHIAYHGRGETPGTFERRPGGRPDPAFQALADNRTRVVADVAAEPSERGADRGYRTYIAVPVVTGHVPHGMLTVDAPEPSVFTDTDVAVAEFTAELLAVAFAEAAR
nr:GAF domain-containing protein [Auraticoccus cholistanensis]